MSAYKNRNIGEVAAGPPAIDMLAVNILVVGGIWEMPIDKI